MISPAITRLDKILDEQFTELHQSQQFRRRTVVTPLDASHVEMGGRRYVNFASNNYLGLTHHPRIMQAAETSLRQYGLGAGAAPLVTGHTEEHAAAELALSRWKGTESAILLPSGYQANHAAIQAIGAVGRQQGGVRFLIDKLAHASLIDAIRSTESPFRVFPHNGLSKLSRLLQEADPSELQVVVTESIFSMDGDPADLPGIVALKRQHAFVLLVDEAHGSGVYGTGGAGYASELGLAGEVDITVVTLSKSLGMVGGAICASQRWCDAIVNFGRAYLFSTAIPPWVASAIPAAIEVICDEPQRQRRVRHLAEALRLQLVAAGFTLPTGDSPILPIILGPACAAVAASAQLREAGLLVPAIRPPTVPRNSSRLRVTLSSAHTDEEIIQLTSALLSLKTMLNNVEPL